jgi:hypothetical protein
VFAVLDGPGSGRVWSGVVKVAPPVVPPEAGAPPALSHTLGVGRIPEPGGQAELEARGGGTAEPGGSLELELAMGGGACHQSGNAPDPPSPAMGPAGKAAEIGIELGHVQLASHEHSQGGGQTQASPFSLTAGGLRRSLTRAEEERSDGVEQGHAPSSSSAVPLTASAARPTGISPGAAPEGSPPTQLVTSESAAEPNRLLRAMASAASVLMGGNISNSQLVGAAFPDSKNQPSPSSGAATAPPSDPHLRHQPLSLTELRQASMSASAAQQRQQWRQPGAARKSQLRSASRLEVLLGAPVHRSASSGSTRAPSPSASTSLHQAPKSSGSSSTRAAARAARGSTQGSRECLPNNLEPTSPSPQGAAARLPLPLLVPGGSQAPVVPPARKQSGGLARSVGGSAFGGGQEMQGKQGAFKAGHATHGSAAGPAAAWVEGWSDSDSDSEWSEARADNGLQDLTGKGRPTGKRGCDPAQAGAPPPAAETAGKRAAVARSWVRDEATRCSVGASCGAEPAAGAAPDKAGAANAEQASPYCYHRLDIRVVDLGGCELGHQGIEQVQRSGGR